MNKKIAVIGLGRFGFTLATSLANQGVEVLAIDSDIDLVEGIADKVSLAVACDAKDPRALEGQGVAQMDVVVVAIGIDFESTMLTTVNLLDLGVKRIIARAMNTTQRQILNKIGIAEVVSPEIEMGITLAKKIINPEMVNFFNLPDNYAIVEVKAPSNIVGRQLQDLGLRKRYQLNLITIKRSTESTPGDATTMEEHIVGVPTPETVIEKDDRIILMGKNDDLERFVEVNA